MNKDYKSLMQVVHRSRVNKRKADVIWNKDEENLLIKLISEKSKLKYISKLLNKSIYAIKVKLKILGIFPKIKRKWSEVDDAALLRFLELGESIESISLKINRGKFAVFDRCKKLGITKMFKQVNNFNYKSEEFILEKALMRRLIGSRGAAACRGFEFKLELIDLLNLWNNQNGKCYYSGLDLSLKNGNQNILSIDRIDSSKGYIKDNVCLCRKDVNIMKFEKSKKDFLDLCKIITEYNSAK